MSVGVTSRYVICESLAYTEFESFYYVRKAAGHVFVYVLEIPVSDPKNDMLSVYMYLCSK